MKPLIWKELRENAGWAALGALALTLAQLWNLNATATSGYGGSNGWFTLVVSTLPQTYGLLPPLLAAALGFLQTVPELRRDQWAFLLHRPLAPSTIYLAKVTAGLLIYALATLVPLLLLGFWLSLPGHLCGPFYPALLLKELLLLLAGPAYYLAAVVTAMRSARWYTTKAAAFPAAVLVSTLLVNGQGPLWVPLALVAGLTGALGLAAHGSFVHRGYYPGYSGWQRLGLGATFLAAYLTLAGCATGLVASLDRRSLAPDFRYMAGAAGVVFRVQFRGNAIAEVRDTSGKLLPPPANKRYWEFSDIGSQGDTPLSFGLRPAADSVQSPSSWATPIGQDSFGEECWFYLKRERRFVAYSKTTGLKVGTLGSTGFADADAPVARPFEGVTFWQNNYSVTQLLFVPDGAFVVDLVSHQLTHFQVPPGAGPVTNGVQILRSYDEDTATRGVQRVMLVAPKQVFLYNGPGKPVFATPRYGALATYTNLRVTYDWKMQHINLWFSPPPTDHTGAALPTYVAQLDGRGRLLHLRELPPLPAAKSPETSLAFYWMAAWMPPAFWSGLLAVLALGCRAGWDWAPQFLASLTDLEWPFATLAIINLVGTVCALPLAAWVGGRAELSPRGRLLWVLAVAALGPLGLLLLLTLWDWPAREECPACGNYRPVTRPLCPHCSAPFAAPERDGTELLELVSAGTNQAN